MELGGQPSRLGHYLQAKRYLGHALEGPGVDQEPLTAVATESRPAGRGDAAIATLSVFAVRLRERGTRILNDRKLAMARLAECTQDKARSDKESAADSAAVHKDSQKSAQVQPLANLASRFSRSSNQTCTEPARWLPLPRWILCKPWRNVGSNCRLDHRGRHWRRIPELAQAQIQLIYDTEIDHATGLRRACRATMPCS